MTDDDLFSLVKTATQRHLHTPAATIQARGRRRRQRQRVTAVSVTAAAAAGLAVAVPALLPGSGPVATPAAWAVERSADTVTVTVNDLRDPQGLQRTLIADGVPALVQFGYQSCVYQASSVDPAGLIVRHRTPPRRRRPLRHQARRATRAHRPQPVDQARLARAPRPEHHQERGRHQERTAGPEPGRRTSGGRGARPSRGNPAL